MGDTGRLRPAGQESEGPELKTQNSKLKTQNFLGLDIGTTHCKAGLFQSDGTPIRIASRPTPVGKSPEGYPAHDPEKLWAALRGAIEEVVADGAAIAAVGVGGMAEAGLLLERATGRPRSEIIPWYDTRSAPQAAGMVTEDEAQARFARTGLRPSFKYGSAKLLWLREHRPGALGGSIWLSVPDWVVYRLTGQMVTDPTLAARTYAFDLQSGTWDEAWLQSHGLDVSLFPSVKASGAPAGGLAPEAGAATGLPPGIPVAVAGHDHLCALLAFGITEPGPVLDSIGTAESLLGVVEELPPAGTGYASGLALVPHVLPQRFCWLGGISAAGASLEWLRGVMGDISHEEMSERARAAYTDPTGILYFPYLSGSGAPRPDQQVRGAFIGLDARQDRADLVNAVYEGVAYEAYAICRTAEQLTGDPIRRVIAAGGGARNRLWMQIKADISGCTYALPSMPEATLLGAALIAALGSELLDLGDVGAIAYKALTNAAEIHPDAPRRQTYTDLYNSYSAFQHALHTYRVKN